jgi:hypothetical protein
VWIERLPGSLAHDARPGLVPAFVPITRFIRHLLQYFYRTRTKLSVALFLKLKLWRAAVKKGMSCFGQKWGRAWLHIFRGWPSSPEMSSNQQRGRRGRVRLLQSSCKAIQSRDVYKRTADATLSVSNLVNCVMSTLELLEERVSDKPSLPN